MGADNREPLCDTCGLPVAPVTLPDSFDHGDYCWRRRAPGSSFEGADVRECLVRTAQRLDAAYARGRKEGLDEAARLVEAAGREVSVNTASEAAEQFANRIRAAAQRPRDDAKGGG